MATRIRDIMITSPVTLRGEQSLFSARELMVIHEYECLFVVNDDAEPVGILTTVDINEDPKKKAVATAMRKDFPKLDPDDTIQAAAQVFARAGMHSLAMAVTNPAGKLVGVVRVRDIVKDLTQSPPRDEGGLSPEQAVMYLTMTRREEKEQTWLQRIRDEGFKPAITQVGATAEKLPIKLRESAIVAAIAFGVIEETEREKIAVSRAVGEIILQIRTINPGLGGGYKVGVVRGEGRIVVAAFGRSGHALANSPEQSYMGTSVL